MTDGRRITDPKSFLENFAMCLIEAGVDVSRITTGVTVLHPQLYSYSGLWERGKGVTERLYRSDASQDAILANSPIKSAYEGSPFRSRLTVPAAEREFPILTELVHPSATEPKLPTGAKQYADIRAVIETGRRQSIGALQAIRNVLAAPIDAILVDTG